jgi:uncharacterized protein YciI
VSYFAVTRERGPNWDGSRSLREQERWDEHAEFMDGLVDDGFIIHGGPVGDGTRTLLMIEAEDAQAIETRFAEDIWTSMDMLRIVSVEPWNVLLGVPSDG